MTHHYILYKSVRKGDSSLLQVGGESVNSALYCGCYKPAAVDAVFETMTDKISQIQNTIKNLGFPKTLYKFIVYKSF